jgi:hypothetical protein
MVGTPIFELSNFPTFYHIYIKNTGGILESGFWAGEI